MFKFLKPKMINTAIEKISDGVIAKMNINEERRNREFTYQLKELEFYKSNYEKDLKDVFDYWFELVKLTHIKDNKNLSDQEQKRLNKKHKEMLSVVTIAKYKMNTLKYGGKETSRILALESSLKQEAFSNKPQYATLYVWCAILSVLKKDILGQDLAPLDTLRVLLNDFYDNEAGLREAERYIINTYKELYEEEPKWIR